MEKQSAIHHQIHEPTGVTHSVCAFLTRRPTLDEALLPNLVLVRATLLQIYEIHAGKLELVDSYPLNGEVESLAVLRDNAKDAQKDAIVLTYREAKAAVVQWKEAEHTVAVSSLHCFEEDLHDKDGKVVFAMGPEAKTDPLGRCACVLFFGNLLALLPARDTEHLEDEALQLLDTVAFCICTPSAYKIRLPHTSSREGLFSVQVLDSVFLHGYNEPVLLILHEPTPTWAALYKSFPDLEGPEARFFPREKKDTRCLTAVSLNLKQKIYPVIWSVKHLPSDAYRLIPVPNGGALVLSMNFISYYNQSQALSMGVNAQAFPTEIPQKMELGASGEMASVKQMVQKFATAVHPVKTDTHVAAAQGELLDVELDAAVWSWLNEVTLLLALKTGQLLVVQLKVDRDTVQDMTIKKSGGAPVASCLSVVDEDLLFIGSWQGDSFLVRFTPVQTQEASHEDVVMEDTAEALHDDDMLLFSGEEAAQPLMSQHQFTFSVVDSLLCTGPIRDMVSGAPPELEAGTQHTSLSPQLVACVGSGRSGALAVMRNGIVAEVLIEVPVPDIEAIWALKYQDEGEHLPLSVTSYVTDAYLLISTASGTMVLQSGEELEEVSDKSDFAVGVKTVFAGSMLRDTRLLQVCPESVRLLKGTELQQELTLEALLSELQPVDVTSSPVPPQEASHSADAAAGCVDVSASDKQPSNVFYDFGFGQEEALPADFMMEDQGMVVPGLGRMEVDSSSSALVFRSASVCDPLVLLQLSDGRGLILETDKDSRQLLPLEPSIPLLFAGAEAEISACCMYLDESLWLSQDRPSAIYDNTIFCIVCRVNGALEIYALPQMELTFSCPAFPLGWKLLTPDMTETPDMSAFPRVTELRMECFSKDHARRDSLISRPVLFALSEDGTLMVYTAFRPLSGTLAFKRLEIDYAGDAAWSQIRQHDKPLPYHRRRLVHFSDLGERHPSQGIFLCGMAPVFFLFSQKGLHVHRLLVDGSVSAMTPFSNVNCPKGFILAMTSDQLKICSLHGDRLDCPWPGSKVPLRCTPHKLAWYPDGRLYLMLTSRPIPFRNRLAEEEGGDTHASAAYVVNEQSAKEQGTEEGHEVRIVVPGSWNTVWHFPFQPNEIGMALKAVRLKNQTEEITQSFVAIGTGTLLGEDYPSTGRILLFKLTRVSSEEWAGQIVWSQECRSPVGLVAVLDGSLLMGIGNRLELCAWTGSEMTRLAFFDAPVFITSANVMKSFVLFGDFLKGIHFVWYTTPTSGHDTSAEAKEMVLLGKDFQQADVFSTEFLVNGTTLRFISADGGKNLHMHGYHRDHPDSWNGRNLVSEYPPPIPSPCMVSSPRGSFHVGHAVTKMLRMRLCSLDGTGRQAALYGTMEGSIGYVASLWDSVLYGRLHRLQTLLILQLPHASGLNPSAFRNATVRPGRASTTGFFKQGRLSPQKDAILDLQLIWRFLHLNLMEQESLAQQIGSHRHQIIEDLQVIAFMTSFF